ncbi:seven-hairpin glycosidase [Dichomitus squalens]|uniref:alpha-1,2-Mannosidase n=1 Tax=Dichomitus squalens TaxID=114155 RepID=A0A4Q9MTJ2_9APHY|nr:seven-hairpin glycosidase [Dichomitus squalens]
MYRHAYAGYLQYATGFDELRPLTNMAVNNFNGWNVTMYDSLDTMLLMGLHEEFAATLPIIAQANFSESTRSPGARGLYAPFFETVIRYLGGLLSAYALSGEKVLLEKADELATLLEPAFTDNGFPVYGIDTASGKPTLGPSGILAEIASCQLEWTYLAHVSGSKVHFDKGNRVIQTLAEAMADAGGGMFATNWNLGLARPGGSQKSVGAAADSAHEYLLKQFLLTDKNDMANLEMYLLSMNEVLTRLLYVTPTRELLFVTDVSGNKFWPSRNFEHLSCFFPGLLALGAHMLPLNLSIIDVHKLSPEAQRQYRLLERYDLRELHMAAAEGLATACWLMYADMPSGLGPEIVAMDPRSRPWIDAVEEWHARGAVGQMPGLRANKPILYTRPAKAKVVEGPWDYAIKRAEYFLRPETIESIYIMWRTTGDPVWRERGWAIFQAIERESKTPSGYASLRNVAESPAEQTDDQPSYFLAETLKYLYLLFTNDDPVPLDKWVFNTEAHPLPVFSWSDWESHKFDIPKSRG